MFDCIQSELYFFAREILRFQTINKLFFNFLVVLKERIGKCTKFISKLTPITEKKGNKQGFGIEESKEKPL